MTTSTHFEIGDAAPANALIPGNLTTLGVSNSFLSPRIYSPGVIQPNPMHQILKLYCQLL